jgi:hypothetical protein
MTNAAAPITITFGGHTLQDADFGIFLEITKGLIENADVRGTDTIIPGAIGRRARTRVADRRDIELAGFVQGTGATEALQRASCWTKIGTLQGWFSPTLTPANLVATLPGGGTKTIVARPLTITAAEQTIPSRVDLVILLESVAPNWT